MSAKLLIGGDIVPTPSNYNLFADGDVEKLIGPDLNELMKSADFIIMNLEVPISDEKNEIVKCGPCLITPQNTIKGLKKINPYFFTLANNHIMDQGEQGLFSTINCLKENKINFAGAGRNLSEAEKSYEVEVKGVRVGIYCCAEHEFSIATESKAGANPYDPLYSFDHVKKLKKKNDIVIVLYHGGKEHYRYPSPELQRIFHKFSEVGADYVIAQHTHCIGCIEKFNNSSLVYGQGNFLFDRSVSIFWKTSLLLEIDVNDDGKHSMKVVPCCKSGNGVRIAQKEADAIISELQKRSREIERPGYIQEKYSEYAENMRKEYYLRLLGGIGRLGIVRLLNKITRYRFLDVIYTRSVLPVIENCFECEAHRELAIQVMQRYTVKKEDES